MRSPAISVVMPFYNAEKFLDESIQSILGQTFNDFELILINDASKDGSENVVERYLKDPRIIYVRNDKRTGIVPNLNSGIKRSKSNIIARMDGDDVATPNRFAQQFDFMQNNPDITLVGTFVEIIDENGISIGKIDKPITHAEIQKVCFYYGPFVHPSVMYRKQDVLDAGGYRQEYEYTEDIDLFFRLIYGGKITANIPEILLKYRQHGNSTAKNAREIGRKSFRLKKEIIKKYNLKPDIKNKATMYIHYTLDMALTGEKKRKLQLKVKKLIRK